MPHHVGLDVSQKTTAICVVDEQGGRLWRGVCATDPEAISARVLRHAGVDVKVGVETGSMTPWLVHGLRSAGLDVECLDARRVKAALQMREQDRRERRRRAGADHAHGMVSPGPREVPHAHRERELASELVFSSWA
jgi:transposase